MRKIVVVSFHDGNKDEVGRDFRGRPISPHKREYEYLAPEDAKGTEKYAVVCPSGKIDGPGNLRIVQVVEFREAMEQSFGGDLKSVVALIDTDAYSGGPPAGSPSIVRFVQDGASLD